MRIGIARAEEHRGAGERARIIPGSAGGPDKAAGQTDHSAVTPRVSRDELQRKASSLRETQEHDPLARNAPCQKVSNKRVKPPQRRVQVRLVRVERRPEGMWGPCIPSRLRGDCCELFSAQLLIQ